RSSSCSRRGERFVLMGLSIQMAIHLLGLATASGPELPSGVDDAVKLWVILNRIEIRILVYQVQSKTVTQRFGKEVQRLHAIARTLATIQGIDAGDLIQIRRPRIAEKRLPGIFRSRFRPTGTSQENAASCSGRHVVRIEGYRPVQDA